MEKKEHYFAGLIGCGDYLRWLLDDMNNSRRIKVKSTFDLDSSKAKLRAEQLNAKPVASAEEIFEDPEISVVYIFTPPWARYDLFKKAVENNKHIITTKPLANSIEEAEKLMNLVNGKVESAVHYGRTGNAGVEFLKDILDSGEIGRLALYKEDWFHHYPTWNNWATDKEKNGGPFMDAMIHNLNKARFLIDSPVKKLSFFSDNHAQKLNCNDTEFMKVDFENGASAHLFITWAADLQVFNPAANEREHYGIEHYITDKGWYVQFQEKDGKEIVRAHKNDEVKEFEIKELKNTPYDQFIEDLETGKKPEPSIEMAFEDIKFLLDK